MIFILAGLLSGSVPVIRSIEPRPATPWVQSSRASCGSNRIEVSGFGTAYPLDKRATIHLNNRPVAGDGMIQLLNDLSHKSSVYRFQVLCGTNGGITLRIGRGEKQPRGAVRYWSSAAFFKANKLTVYHPPEENNEEGFFFR